MSLREVGDSGDCRAEALQLLLLEIALFAEDSAAHLKDSLESLTADNGVFAETFDASLLDLVLDLLPSTTESGDLRLLSELGGGGRVDR